MQKFVPKFVEFREVREYEDSFLVSVFYQRGVLYRVWNPSDTASKTSLYDPELAWNSDCFPRREMADVCKSHRRLGAWGRSSERWGRGKLLIFPLGRFSLLQKEKGREINTLLSSGDPRQYRKRRPCCGIRTSPWVLENYDEMCTRIDPLFHGAKCDVTYTVEFPAAGKWKTCNRQIYSHRFKLWTCYNESIRGSLDI